jgi:hypothetical protein
MLKTAADLLRMRESRRGPPRDDARATDFACCDATLRSLLEKHALALQPVRIRTRRSKNLTACRSDAANIVGCIPLKQYGNGATSLIENVDCTRPSLRNSGQRQFPRMQKQSTHFVEGGEFCAQTACATEMHQVVSGRLRCLLHVDKVKKSGYQPVRRSRQRKIGSSWSRLLRTCLSCSDHRSI